MPGWLDWLSWQVIVSRETVKDAMISATAKSPDLKKRVSRETRKR
jgi:hypothetical protein